MASAFFLEIVWFIFHQVGKKDIDEKVSRQKDE